MSDAALTAVREHRPLPEQPFEVDGGRKLRLALLPDEARFVLRIAPADAAAAGAVFGLPLPDTIGGLAEGDGRLAVKLGPDEWRLHADVAAGPGIESAFAERLAGQPHSLVDVGHREVGFEVSGSAALAALGAISPLDLAARPVGSGTRTVLDRVEAVVLRLEEDRFRVEVWRSFAPFVYSLLERVGAEIEAGL